MRAYSRPGCPAYTRRGPPCVGAVACASGAGPQRALADLRASLRPYLCSTGCAHVLLATASASSTPLVPNCMLVQRPAAARALTRPPLNSAHTWLGLCSSTAGALRVGPVPALPVCCGGPLLLPYPCRPPDRTPAPQVLDLRRQKSAAVYNTVIFAPRGARPRAASPRAATRRRGSALVGPRPAAGRAAPRSAARRPARPSWPGGGGCA